jgi:hypothetical protein
MEAHAIAIADPRNRRAEPRARTLKRGLIVFHDGHSVFDCTVRNLSSGGAMLLFGDPVGVPSHFDLAIRPSHDRRVCTVRWRDENALGVSFDTIH